MNFKVEFTNEIISNNTGLVLVNNILNKTLFIEKINNGYKTNLIKNGDIIKTYLGILATGNTEFERAEEYRKDSFFKQSLNLKKIPSCSILRQRLDALANEEKSDVKEIFKIIDETNVELIKNNNIKLEPCFKQFIPVDIDVTPFDNSNSNKEGVSYTYKKFNGYAPIIGYIGNQGFLLKAELRSGSSHSQCAKTVPYLNRVIKMAKEITKEPLLFRLDSAHDCPDNILLFHENADFIMKAKNTIATKPKYFFEKALELEKAIKTKSRYGKERYIYSYTKKYICKKKDQASEILERRIVVETIKRTMDRDGQVLLTPEYETKRYVTSLGNDITNEDIIEVYHNHGTSEQFHSELKSDMGVEKLPSGKFSTNELVLGLASIVFNILRIIGQTTLKINPSKVSRKRVKTVIKDIILFACKLVSHARKKILRIYSNLPCSNLFKTLCEFII